MINVSINGKIEEIEENLNVQQILSILNYTSDAFAVAINTTFVPIKKYEEVVIKDGDNIDILSPIQGG